MKTARSNTSCRRSSLHFGSRHRSLRKEDLRTPDVVCTEDTPYIHSFVLRAATARCVAGYFLSIGLSDFAAEGGTGEIAFLEGALD
jgi:hypothetical protein